MSSESTPTAVAPFSPTVRPVAREVRLDLSDAGVRRAGRWLFRHLDLRLHAGEVVAVTGPSGTGKSTLLSCLGGAVPLDEGRIGVASARSSRGNEAQTTKINDPAHIVAHRFPPPHVRAYKTGNVAPAWVFQDLRLVAQATLLANVLMARLPRYAWWQTLWSFPPAERQAAFTQLIELEIGHLALRPVRETSGGEQQRAAIARALFAQSPVLLADEPVANLNEELAARVLHRLRREARERGALVICVLHHEDQVREFADTALRLSPEFTNGWQRETIG